MQSGLKLRKTPSGIDIAHRTDLLLDNAHCMALSLRHNTFIQLTTCNKVIWVCEVVNVQSALILWSKILHHYSNLLNSSIFLHSIAQRLTCINSALGEWRGGDASASKKHDRTTNVWRWWIMSRARLRARHSHRVWKKPSKSTHVAFHCCLDSCADRDH